VSNPTVTVTPASGPAGTVVTVKIVRDTPATPETVTVTTPIGTGVGTFTVVENVAVTVTGGRAFTTDSDDGTTLIGHFTA
jgi:hypothetical protein